MTVWLTRAGKHGENEQTALNNGIVTIGWNEVPDLATVQDRDHLAELYKEIHPDHSGPQVAAAVGQLWAFRNRIQQDDLVVLPLKTQSAIAIGRITGPYEYRNEFGDAVHHTRRVDWLQTDIPRARFDQDILYSFGAFMTVCQIKRNNAEDRIKTVFNGRVDPGSTNEDGIEDDVGSQSLDVAVPWSGLLARTI